MQPSTLDPEYETLKVRLRDLMEARDISDRELSRIVTAGRSANESYIGQVLSGKNGMPGSGRLAKIAEQLGTTTDYLVGRADTPDQLASEVRFAEMPQPWRGREIEGIPVLGTAFCDDLAVEADDGGNFEVERVLLETDHVIMMIERPRALVAARDAYAIYLEGESMFPRYRPGHLCIVDPRRPPKHGDDVVVQLTDGNGGRDVVTVIVKELVRATSREVELRQYNPARTFSIPRSQVVALHRICDSNELFGA